MDEILAVLKDIRYELQLANWLERGGKRVGDPPLRPGEEERFELESFNGKTVRVMKTRPDEGSVA